MQPYTVERKAGLNRGKRRIWIEGKDLLNAGFGQNTRFDSEFLNGSIILTLNPEGGRKVSGKIKPNGEFHPIIDLIGEKVAQSINNSERVNVTYAAGKITIKPII